MVVANISPLIHLIDGGERRLLADLGRVDPTSLASYREHGGYSGLTRAIERLSPEQVIAEIDAAGLRGRGGSGYRTAAKWRAARDAAGDRKIVVANLMGADPSALGDRVLAEGNPHLVVEGALIAAFAAGASEGIIAVRRDWTLAIERLRAAIDEATAAHLAGYLVLATDVSVMLSLWEGSGAYVAGEETALIHALQGDRGMPLIRPPYPTERGLFGVPTIVQNGETLAHATWIMQHSADAFASVGTEASKGTKLVTVLGRAVEPGVLEVPFGATLLEILTLAGGGEGTTKALFIGGPGAGAVEAGGFDLAYDYGPLAAAGALVGSGSVLVTNANDCMVDTSRFLLAFSSREACGKAVPCRIGTKRLVEGLDRVLAATPRPDDFTLLRELSRKVADTALCRLEAIASRPMLTTLDLFPEEYRAHADRGECLAGACRVDVVAPLHAELPGLEVAPGASDGR